MQKPLVSEIVDYMSEGISVNLVGLGCSGRTTVADSVVRQLSDQGLKVVRITGFNLLADRPLAALAAAGIEATTSGGSSIGVAVAALSKRLSNGSVLVIDDADDLDSATAGVIAACRAQARFPALAVSRLRGDQPSTAQQLIAGFQPVVRLRMRPMEFADLHAMLRQLLPGDIGSSLIARVAVFTGCLPSLVEATVKNAQRMGIVRQKDGMWEIEKDLYSSRLAEAIEPLLYGLDDEKVAALTKISLLTSLEESSVDRVIGRENYTSLIELGLLQTTNGRGGPLVGVFPPAVSRYLLHELPAPRRRQVIEELDQAEQDDAFRLIGRTSSKPVEAESSVFHPHHMREYWRSETARLFAEWEADPVPQRAIPLISAMNSAGEPAEETLDIARNTKKTRDNWMAALLMWEATDRGVRMNDLQGSLDMMAAAAESMPQYRHMFWFTKMNMEFILDRVPQIPAPEISDEDDPSSTEFYKVGNIWTSIAQGRLDDAMDLLNTPKTRSNFLEYGSIERGFVLLFSGQIDKAIEWSRSEFLKAQDKMEPGLAQSHAFVLALALCLQGHFSDADTVTSSALTLMGDSTIYKVYSSGLLSLAAQAAAWEGRDEYAQSLANQAKDQGRLGPYPAMIGHLTPGLVKAGPETIKQLWEAVDDRLDRGYSMAGVFLAAMVVEHNPDLHRAQRVYEESQGMQSSFMKTLGHYVLAVGTGNADLLRQTQAELIESKSVMFALRAGVQLAILLRNQDDPEGAVKVASETWRYGHSLSSIRSVLFGPLVQTLELSSREGDIVSYILQEKVPSEIGSELNLSVRTVENHINSIYRKVGVNSRVELQKALDTWLSELR